MKNLVTLTALVFLAPLIARADGYGWKGHCEEVRHTFVPLSVDIQPWDDDAKVVVVIPRNTLYSGIPVVSTFDPNAKEVRFTDADPEKMTLKITRSDPVPQGNGELSLNGRVYLLNCNIGTVSE